MCIVYVSYMQVQCKVLFVCVHSVWQFAMVKDLQCVDTGIGPFHRASCESLGKLEILNKQTREIKKMIR